MFVPLRKAVEILGLHPNTLRKYADQGKIRIIKNEAGQRLYDVQSYIDGAARASIICYCRVSSSKQRDDLERQVSFMRSVYPEVAKFLTDNFDVILLPTFEVSEMVVKNSGKIRSKSVRQMLNWSHYRFKEFLKHKAFETGKRVIDCCEAYTSKTVSWTGELVQNLGGKKVIKSQFENKAMDRDLNGARGIFLRALVDTPSLTRRNLIDELERVIQSLTESYLDIYIGTETE